MTDEQKMKIKIANEAAIKLQGYKVNDWLPVLDLPQIRSIEEIKGRLLVLTAMINIAFNAPINFIKAWLFKHNLDKYLSRSEHQILAKENSELTDADLNPLRWSLESLWAFLWITKQIVDLIPEEPVGDNMAVLVPNLQKNEGIEKIENISGIQEKDRLYQMLDYYYRLHWFCVNERLSNNKSSLNEGIIHERRKALEWFYNKNCGWDDMELST